MLASSPCRPSRPASRRPAATALAWSWSAVRRRWPAHVAHLAAFRPRCTRLALLRRPGRIALCSAFDPSRPYSLELPGSRPRSTRHSSIVSATTVFPARAIRGRHRRTSLKPLSSPAPMRRQHMVAAELDAADVDDQIVPVVQPPLRQLNEPTSPACLGRLPARRGLAHARSLGHLPDRLAVGPRTQPGQQQSSSIRSPRPRTAVLSQPRFSGIASSLLAVVIAS